MNAVVSPHLAPSIPAPLHRGYTGNNAAEVLHWKSEQVSLQKFSSSRFVSPHPCYLPRPLTFWHFSEVVFIFKVQLVWWCVEPLTSWDVCACVCVCVCVRLFMICSPAALLLSYHHKSVICAVLQGDNHKWNYGNTNIWTMTFASYLCHSTFQHGGKKICSNLIVPDST